MNRIEKPEVVRAGRTQFYLSHDEMIEAVRMWLVIHKEEIPKGKANLYLTGSRSRVDIDFDSERWATLSIEHHERNSG